MVIDCQPFCKYMLPHTHSQVQGHQQPYTCTCVTLSMFDPPPMLVPSHPSTVHDELLSQLVTCKIKNIKQSAGSTIIIPKGSFMHNSSFFIYESMYSTPQKLCHVIVILLYYHCFIAWMFMLQVSHLLEPMLI